MKYAEIVIGPPGSGKSTYVMNKKASLSHRHPFAINLDPGNKRDTGFDYSICSISSSREFQETHDVGPNMSSKMILEEFSSSFEEIFREHIEDTDHYLLLDFPGQIELFICSDVPNNILGYLKRNGYSVVVINLIDLVFFTNSHSLISSYMISTLCLCLLESAQVNVISKCDNWDRLNLEHPLRDIADLTCLSEMKSSLHTEMIDFVHNQCLLSYEILDYDNLDSISYLQVAIDRASGLLFEDDYFEVEKITAVPSRDNVFSKYTH